MYPSILHNAVSLKPTGGEGHNLEVTLTEAVLFRCPRIEHRKEATDSGATMPCRCDILGTQFAYSPPQAAF